jgi:hypothetical protein
VLVIDHDKSQFAVKAKLQFCACQLDQYGIKAAEVHPRQLLCMATSSISQILLWEDPGRKGDMALFYLHLWLILNIALSCQLYALQLGLLKLEP